MNAASFDAQSFNTAPLDTVPFNYVLPEGALDAAATPRGFERLEHQAVVGAGAADLERLGALVLDWQIQRRSGIRVLDLAGVDAASAQVGQTVRLSIPLVVAAPAELRLFAPARVLRVVRAPRYVGFAYGTLRGHPERGEESFGVRLRDDDTVVFELRGLSRPAMPFALAAPVGRRFQRRFTVRYLRALLD